MKSPKFLIAITTYGSPAYIDLSLSFLKIFGYKNVEIVVFDDCSKDERLNEICKKHNVKLISTEKNNGHFAGDLILINKALKYGIENNCDYLIKMSRKWICMASPYESLNWLIEHTDGTTFSNKTKLFEFGFRSEFMCLKLNEWSKNIEKIENELKIPDPNSIFVEHFIHDLARETEPDTYKYNSYKIAHPFGNEFSGYVRWDWMGDDRGNPPKYILWHDRHGPTDYFNKSKEIGLNWTLQDFE